MPRKKLPPKFKYTYRKGEILFVVYPLDGLKYPVWRKCEPETQARVDEIIEEIKNERARRIHESAVPGGCDKFFDFWLEQMRNRVSERTHQGYENIIDRYLRPALGGLDLSEIKPLHLQNLYASMTAQGLSAQTVRHTRAVASGIFKEAVNLDAAASNPVSRSKSPRVAGSLKIKVLDQAEVKRFLAACRIKPYGVIFEFALETGMRPQEYLALRWTDINLERKSAEILRALVYDRKGGGYYFKEPKTRRSRRTVPLSTQLVERLKIHREKQDEYIEDIEARLTKRCKPSRENRREHNKQILENHKKLNLVFPSQDFTPFKDINLGRRYFKEVAKDAGLDAGLGLYSLRHTCATLLLSANVNPKIVSERLGHSSVSITLDVYSHVLPTMQADATEKLMEMLYK